MKGLTIKTPTFILLTLLSISCASAPGSGKGAAVPAPAPVPAQPGDGSFEGRTYSNRFFGLRITTPEGWSVATPEEAGLFQDTGEELLAGEDEMRRARLRAATKRTTTLLTASRFPIGTPGKPNAALQLIAEYIPLTAIADGDAYLEGVRQQLERGPVASAYQPQGDIGHRSIGGREFATLLYHVDVNGVALSQLYMASKSNLHVLACVLTWQTESDREELEKFLESLRFS